MGDGDRYDFSNPFVSAAIVSVDGKRYPLWSGLDEKDAGTAGLGSTAALAFLQEVTIEIQLAYLPLIKATLSPPYRDAINFLDSSLMEWAGGARLEVQFGYLSNTSQNAVLSNVFTGMMGKPEVQLGTDCTITLNAQGVGSFSASRQEGRRTFRDMTRMEILTIIAEGRIQTGSKVYKWGGHGSSGFTIQDGTRSYTFAEPTDLDAVEGLPPDSKDPYRQQIRSRVIKSWVTYQMTLQEVKRASRKRKWGRRKREAALARVRVSGVSTIPGEFGKKNREIKIDETLVTKDNDADSYRLLKEEPINYSQGGKTDWQAVWELVRESQCSSYWEGGCLKIVPRNVSFAKAPAKRTFRVFDYPGGVIGPAEGEFPILSASSPFMYMYMSGATRGLVVSGCSSEDRKAETAIIDDSMVQPGRTSKGGSALANSPTMPPTDAATGTNAKTFPGAPSSDRAVAQAKAEYSNMTEASGVPLTIETLADPRLFPGEAIHVRGLGARLDTRYVVFKQNYTLGGSGANMSMELRSNAAVVDNTLISEGPTPSKRLRESWEGLKSSYEGVEIIAKEGLKSAYEGVETVAKGIKGIFG